MSDVEPTLGERAMVKYALVLERMIALLDAEHGLTFDAALKRASAELETPVSPDMEATLLTVAFKVITGRKKP